MPMAKQIALSDESRVQSHVNTKRAFRGRAEWMALSNNSRDSALETGLSELFVLTHQLCGS